MTHLTLHSDQRQLVKPEPRMPITIRLAELRDVPFIDQLQRKHARMVGWFPTRQIEANIVKGHVLIAEETQDGGTGVWPVPVPGESTGGGSTGGTAVPPKPVGYVIAHDKYLKREELGIVYQLNVAPGRQRGLIGATLINAVFDRAAYGCKLFCCWCAQDLEANHFWESIGFVPLAFRAGSRPRMKKDGTVSKPGRTHIFWQKRIREGDVETPYWFPSETSGGALKENRLVLPIPPGTHWSDAKPAVLPGVNALLLEADAERAQAERDGVQERERSSAGERKKKKEKAAVAPVKPSTGLWFAPPTPPEPSAEEVAAKKKAEREAKRHQRERFRNDPKLIAAARELRDKYLEQLDAGLILPPSSCGKYDVSRQLAGASSVERVQQLQGGGAAGSGEVTLPLLEAA